MKSKIKPLVDRSLPQAKFLEAQIKLAIGQESVFSIQAYEDRENPLFMYIPEGWDENFLDKQGLKGLKYMRDKYGCNVCARMGVVTTIQFRRLFKNDKDFNETINGFKKIYYETNN